MRTHRCPILVWRVADGPWTAALVEEQCRAAVGDSPRSAIEQLRALREWQYRNQSWRELPDLTQAELRMVRVLLRPEYVMERTQRRYPVRDVFELKAWVVLGQQSGGLLLASFPMFDLRILIDAKEDVESTLRSHLRRWFEGCTPEQLSRYIPPDDVQLQDMYVTLDGPRQATAPEFPTNLLEQIADPAGSPEIRELLGRAWERDHDIHELSRQLLNEKSSLLILGPAGSGRTTVLCDSIRHVERLLRQQERRQSSSWFAKPSRRFWMTSAGRLISGMKYLGQWQERLENIIRQLTSIDGALCIDSLLELAQTGGREASDSLAAFCLPYIQRGELRIIAEATVEQFDACRRLLPTLTDVFRVFPLTPPDADQTIQILQRLSSHAGITMPVDPLSASTALRLFRRFEPYHALPGQVTEFWKDLLNQSRRAQQNCVTPNHVLDGFLRRTGLPERFLRDDIPVAYQEIERELSGQVIGQPEACRAMADVIVRFKAAMNDAARPLGVLLLCGPTGVGKTELAKAASRCLFGGCDDTKSRLIRLDMSEYSGPWAADRLLFQPSGEPSVMIQAVRRQPFSVLLLDEMEKAHPDVFDMLMNVFDEGKLTDRHGRITWFRSTLILMTSNLGSDTSRAVGFGNESSAKHRVEAAIRGFFRPEFFNRMDAVVSFNQLDSGSIRQIAEKELFDVGQREGLQRRGLKLVWEPAVVDFLVKTGFDAQYGARPLQRMLETQVTTPIARFLVCHPGLRDSVIQLQMSHSDGIDISVAR
ncbi:MAG: ATP-dependent Clp protease ATP-binding subunit [Planctomycetaceae bacterium]|nr:ATP-dependent Clp protease ATP-binding subunit [Planctomycetaceae bacterium]